MDPSQTIESLKAIIQEKEAIPSDQQCLIFALGTFQCELSDERTISDYKIEQDSIVSLVIRMKGGAVGFHNLQEVLRDEAINGYSPFF